MGRPLNPDAVVYRLGGDAPDEFRNWLALGEDLLLLLDSDLRPRLGDASHSFTLSRASPPQPGIRHPSVPSVSSR